MLRHTENPGIFRNILLPPNLYILKTLHIIYRQIQVDLKPRLSQACYAYGIFTTLDILKDICPHFGIFHQFWAYSESWYSYSMPPCYTVQYTTHARTNSMPFLKLTKKKGSGGLSIYQNIQRTNKLSHCENFRNFCKGTVFA